MIFGDSYVEPAGILKVYNDLPQDQIQETLNAKTIIGCNAYLQTMIANFPHNSGIRASIIKLRNDLSQFPTFNMLDHFFATIEAVSSKNDAASYLLIVDPKLIFNRNT